MMMLQLMGDLFYTLVSVFFRLFRLFGLLYTFQCINNRYIIMLNTKLLDSGIDILRQFCVVVVVLLQIISHCKDEGDFLVIIFGYYYKYVKFYNNTPFKINNYSRFMILNNQIDEQPIAASFKTENYSARIEPINQAQQFEITQSLPRGFLSKSTNSKLENFVEIKQMSIAELRAQNTRLKHINRELRKKLQQFQRKLDESIKKHRYKQEQTKYKVGQEIVESMELRNAYKMCEIYKKQIAQLKKQEAFSKATKIEELNNIISQLEKDKEKLMGEIKDLKKVNRQQEKGLKQMITPNVIKLVHQNEQLKQQIRKLQQREYNEIKNSKYIIHEKKKDKVQFNSLQLYKILRQDQENKDFTHVQNLKNKVLKDNRKISLLISENIKLRQNVEQLRSQIVDKDKQCTQLREKFKNSNKGQMRQSSFRRKRIITQSQISNRKQTKMEAEVFQEKKQLTSLAHRKLKSQLNTLSTSSKIAKQKQRKQVLNSSIISAEKTPKILVMGEKDEENYSWNHFKLNSKIKQIQVSVHSSGHIMEINFRYQKGQPKTYSKNPYTSFCCQQNSGQYIACVNGGFKAGLLQYLVVQTSKGRKSSFGQSDLKYECINFKFKGEENEYLGAFFGENSNEGVTRLGCYIQQQN